ncbi:MAG TPA: AraC family ligand binding domain-containing protein [Candidatus Acidoferrales bacterium]|nr:AraC family ligand binding domain-containing protein [Candidatus Acidoferrales bacterium]
MHSEHAQTFSLSELARDFATEVAGASERKKKNLTSYPGLQTFLLYIRAQGTVPTHQVSGAITVQTLIGHVHFTAAGNTHPMPTGAIIALAPGVPHELSADGESVVLVTHAIGA